MQVTEHESTNSASEMMIRRLTRRFTMIDAMIIVGAFAVAFGMVRPLSGESFQRIPGWVLGLSFVFACVVTLTPTILVLRLFKPRLTIRHLCRQPGFVAGVAGSATLALGILAIAIIAIIRLIKSGMVTASGRPALTPDPTWWISVMTHFGAVVGPAVIVAWLMLALSGRRRPVRHWLDYLGRAIGIAWIMLFILNCCARLAHTTD